MDVTCERCGTDYEFDETLVSSRGTTVKCTNCGHLFKVFRDGERPDSAESGRTWSLRKRDGSTQIIGSLRLLQRMITTGELKQDDEISRSGEGWKRLGDIAELQTFFAAAQAGASPSSRPRADATLPFVTGTTGPATGTLPLAEEPTRKQTPDESKIERLPKAPLGSIPAGPGTHPPKPISTAPPRNLGAAPGPRGKQTIFGTGPRSRIPSPAPMPRQTPSTGSPAEASAAAPAGPKRTLYGVGGDGAASDRPPSAFEPPSSTPRPSVEPLSTTLAAMAVPSAQRNEHTPLGPSGGAWAEVPGGPSAFPSEPPESEPPPSESARRGRTATPTPKLPPLGSQHVNSTGSRPLYYEDETPYTLPGRPKVGRWIVVVAILALGGGAFVARDKLSALIAEPTPGAPRADAFLGRATKALERADEAGYDQAIQEFAGASAVDPTSAVAAVGLSETHARWAQMLSFEASDLEGRAQGDAAVLAAVTRTRENEKRHIEQSLQAAEQALRNDPTSADAEVALADAYRLQGDLEKARSHLSRASSLQQEAGPRWLRVAGLADAAEGHDLSLARTKLSEALLRSPGDLDLELLIVRALISARELNQARTTLGALLRQHPDHALAKALERALETATPAAEAAAPAAQATPVEAASTLDVAPASAAVTPSPGGRPNPRPGGAATGPIPRGQDVDWYIAQGNNALDRGDVRRAKQLFDEALGARPGNPEATAGLGWVALETGSSARAQALFERAAQSGYAEAYIGLADTNRRLGRDAEALAAYERYLERSPSGPSASIARSWVSRLRDAQPPAPTPSPEEDPGGEGTTDNPTAAPEAPPPPTSDPPALEAEP